MASAATQYSQLQSVLGVYDHLVNTGGSLVWDALSSSDYDKSMLYRISLDSK